MSIAIAPIHPRPIRNIEYKFVPNTKDTRARFTLTLDHLTRDSGSMKKIDCFIIELLRQNNKSQFIPEVYYLEGYSRPEIFYRTEFSRVVDKEKCARPEIYYDEKPSSNIYNEKTNTHDFWEKISISFYIDGNCSDFCRDEKKIYAIGRSIIELNLLHYFGITVPTED